MEGQGIVILHHAIGAFPQWQFWSDLMGVRHRDRAYDVPEFLEIGGTWLSWGETRHIEIADPHHPIVRGLEAWDLIGETWNFLDIVPKPDCDLILTTDHPKMLSHAMAWTHQFKKSRVFCLQPGHDNDTWTDPHFRTVLLRGIQWVAGRL